MGVVSSSQASLCKSPRRRNKQRKERSEKLQTEGGGIKH